jgi:DNA-directed RNA polymerase subunit M/transcription elongation factor TFIIS
MSNQSNYRKLTKNQFKALKLSNDIVNDIEQSIYDVAITKSQKHSTYGDFNDIRFRVFYKNTYNSVYLNMDKTTYIKNETFYDRIVSGEIDPKIVALIKPHDVFPIRWSECIETNKKKDEIKYSRRKEQFTDIYHCGRCHKNECSYFEMQVRSIDEPMTTFIRCENCGHRWREN